MKEEKQETEMKFEEQKVVVEQLKSDVEAQRKINEEIVGSDPSMEVRYLLPNCNQCC